MEKSEDKKNDLSELGIDLGPRIDEARERLRDANQRALACIKERPVTCLVGALAVGYLIGRILRR
jgi:hypothetical protein